MRKQLLPEEGVWSNRMTIRSEEMKKQYMKFFVIAASLILIAGMVTTPAKSASDTTCGDNVVWSLDKDTGVFTISGEGPMYEYEFDDLYGEPTVPWCAVRSSIKKVVVEDGVTSVGAYAFYECQNLTEVIIGDDVETIGNDAFRHSNYITKIELGKNLKEINTVWECWSSLKELHISDLTDCFTLNLPRGGSWGCAYLYLDGVKLTEVTVPETITEVPSGSFWGYGGITSITIPKTVTYIGGMAFDCPDLQNIYYDGNIARWVEIARDAKSYTTKSVNLYIDGELVKDVNIPDTVTAIGDYAFYNCATISSVNIPANVLSVGEGAFKECNVLKSVAFAEGLRTVGANAFADCVALEDVEFFDGVESLGEYVFSGCSSLKRIAMPSSVKSIGMYAFQNCTALSTLMLPENVRAISEGMFTNCTGLKALTIPASVTVIETKAFENCNGLESVDIPGSVSSIGGTVFSGCTKLRDVKIGNGVTSIEAGAFADLSLLTDISLPDSVKSIGKRAFQNCVGLTEITLSSGLNIIDDYAFDGCSNIDVLTVPGQVTRMGSYAFSGLNKITELVVPASVVTIDAHAFNLCSSLTKITFLGTAPSIGENAFKSVTATCYYTPGESWTNEILTADYGGDLIWTYEGKVEDDKYYSCGEDVIWEITEDGTLTLSGNGPMYDYSVDDLNYAPWYDLRTSVLRIEIGEGITRIGDAAFYSCTNATSVKMPDTIVSIGAQAFENCGLTSVRWSNNVVEIGEKAFKNGAPSEMILPESLTTVGEYAFSSSLRLTKVVLPDNLTYIPTGMFNGCLYLLDVDFQDTLTEIGNSAFSACFGLNSVVLPEGLTSIGRNAFNSCGAVIHSESYDADNFVSITLPSTLKSIGEQAFWYCQSLRSIVVPDGVEVIKANTFGNCTGLSSVTLPTKITSIGKDAFLGCSALRTVTFKWGAPNIDLCAFSRKVTATCYYPGNNPAWSSDMLQNYNANKLTWIAQEMEVPSETPVGGGGENTEGGNTGTGGGSGSNNEGGNTGTGSGTSIQISTNVVGGDTFGAVIHAPTSGWTAGTNVFTVSCERACVVGVSYDNGETYTELVATATGDENTYSFTVENATENTVIAVALRGDVNGDGAITNADVTRLKAAYQKKNELDPVALLVADVNKSGNISNADVTKLKAVYQNKTVLSW